MSERIAELVSEVNELRAVLQRIGGEKWILDEGLGGGYKEELHVRLNLARQVLGLSVCGCTECQVSLGLEPDAVVTSGTEHLAEQLHRAASADEAP